MLVAMSADGNHCEELIADCRLRAATDLFAHTWDPVVLAALSEGARRRHELRAAIGGMSDKVLTEALRRLLANGLIHRRAYAEAPPRVEYGLTGLGESLVNGPLMALGNWVRVHGDELLDAQERAASIAREAIRSKSPLLQNEAGDGRRR
ncbi:helix-turn-helix domain-containing protein [Amycolatopsis taiwanensis]|uniref:winged helix-turn-helix transcriptional regulator n=1 Tax=Amycolatopsis taiwanensis TaxID=342230 RepID=UPI0004B7B881